jgi:hypothetical protein
VPESVITRFFSTEKVLSEFLQLGNKQAFNHLMIDVFKTYKITDESYNQVTELAYVLFERLKDSEHENSLATLVSEHLKDERKSNDLIVHIVFSLL